MIDFSLQIKIDDVHAWMDGGSITLICRNEKKQEFEIEFVQHVSWTLYKKQNMPARIYLNKKLVDQRSQLETEIINGLKKANLELKDFMDWKILNEKLAYVSSEEYLTDQKKIKEK